MKIKNDAPKLYIPDSFYERLSYMALGDYLKDKQAVKMQNAIDLIEDFQSSLDKLDLIEDM